MKRKSKMEAAIDFKSLRAKFQEGSHMKDRPVVLDKPKRFPPITIRSSSLPISALEENNPATLPFNLRDDQKMLSGKRPSVVQASFFPPDANGVGCGVSRRSLKDRHLPLVLPTFSSSSYNPKQEASAPTKLVTSPIKCKKKAMPTPFKPAKFTKSIKDILENAEHPVHGKSDRYTVENGFSYQNGGSNSGSSCPSPEYPSTPSPTSEDSSSVGSVPHVLSTLERAKKKFSPKNLLVYTRPKSFYSSKGLSESPPLPPPPVEYENLQCDAESLSLRSGHQPTNSPTFTARCLPQPNGIHQRPGPVLHLNGDMKPVWPGVHVPPLIKALPDITSMGSLPKKPPRPPHVDLSTYRTHELENITENASMILAPGSEAVDAENPPTPTPPPPQIDAPHFLEFASSVLEAFNTNEINLAALEMEPTDITGPEEENYSSRHNIVNQNHGTGPQDLGDAYLQRSSLGYVADSQSVSACDSPQQEAVTAETSMTVPHNILTNSHVSNEVPSEPSITQRDDHYEVGDNVYEEVESISKFNFGQNSRKRKGAPKNPYAESLAKEEACKSVWHVQQGVSVTSEPSGVTPAVWDSGASVRKERFSPDHHDEKEARKREKQRLEREKKEQKEKEKKENEMKKKFKITGQEEPMYHARVLLASKLRKHDLQVKSGDTVSIIRTTNCPKGKWLARDSQNKYGYISVMNVELNMKEMLELGKRASQAIGRGHGEADTLSLSSRSSQYNPVLTSSFTDDSEEWTPDDDDETLSHFAENSCPNRAVSLPDVFNALGSDQHAPNADSVEDIPSQVNHEALQKLAVFFQNTRDDLNTVAEIPDPLSTSINAPGLPCDMDEPPYVEEDQYSFTDVELLPPPELYADYA